MGDTALERYNPLLMQSLLAAVRRFEPDFYSHLCRAYHLDADRMLGLFREVDELGAAQLAQLLAELRLHQAYHDITYLAGRNAFHQFIEQQKLHPGVFSLGQAGRFGSLIKQSLPPFLGVSSFVHLVRGDLQFVEIRDSVFARRVRSERPLCGFYCGFLAEMGGQANGGQATAGEVRCAAVDPDAQSCLLQVSL